MLTLEQIKAAYEKTGLKPQRYEDAYHFGQEVARELLG